MYHLEWKGAVPYNGHESCPVIWALRLCGDLEHETWEKISSHSQPLNRLAQTAIRNSRLQHFVGSNTMAENVFAYRSKHPSEISIHGGGIRKRQASRKPTGRVRTIVWYWRWSDFFTVAGLTGVTVGVFHGQMTWQLVRSIPKWIFWR